jgi:hypothetical protein
MTGKPPNQVVEGEVLVERRPSLAAPVCVALLLLAVLAVVLLRELGDAPGPGDSTGQVRASAGLAGAAVGARG